jgi:hypothetical protein
MAITFGSVGDIISTVQIAIQLLTALNESRGSASEFQDLVKSLSTFHRILEQVCFFSIKFNYASWYSNLRTRLLMVSSLSKYGPLDLNVLNSKLSTRPSSLSYASAEGKS